MFPIRDLGGLAHVLTVGSDECDGEYLLLLVAAHGLRVGEVVLVTVERHKIRVMLQVTSPRKAKSKLK